MNDAFVAFCCGLMSGLVLGVFMFSVIIAIETGEFKRPGAVVREELDPDRRQNLERED